jgi:hypothetical protein
MKRLNLSVIAALGICTLAATALPVRAASEEQRFPTFGLRLTPPVNATFQPPSQPTQIAYYQLPASGTDKPMAILVEVQPKVDKSAAAVADQFVHLGATVVRSLKVNNEDAVELSADMNQGGFTHRVSCIVVHDRREYIFSIFSKSDKDSPQTNDGAPILEQLLSTVDFRPPESPLDHADEMFDKPLTVLDAISIDSPTFLRTYVRKSDQLVLGARDFLVDDESFFTEFHFLKTPPGATFASIQAAVSQQIRKNVKVPEDLQWTTSDKEPRLHISQAQPGTVSTPAGDVHLVLRYSFLELLDGRTLQITFSIPDRGPKTVQSYVELSDKMLDSVKLISSHAAASDK